MSTPPIFIVSGGAGLSGEQLWTALAQFASADVLIEIVPHAATSSRTW